MNHSLELVGCPHLSSECLSQIVVGYKNLVLEMAVVQALDSLDPVSDSISRSARHCVLKP